jgi:alcohol dehydrogenase
MPSRTSSAAATTRPHGLANAIVLPHVLRFSLAPTVTDRLATLAVRAGLGDEGRE